jgi:hypothetical protein
MDVGAAVTMPLLIRNRLDPPNDSRRRASVRTRVNTERVRRSPNRTEPTSPVRVKREARRDATETTQSVIIHRDDVDESVRIDAFLLEKYPMGPSKKPEIFFHT